MSSRGRGGVALLAAVAAAGCGHAQTQRTAVAHYVTRLNHIEASLSSPLTSVTHAGAAFASELHAGPVTEGPILNSAEQTLYRSLTQISAAQTRLELLTAPVPARHLRSLVLSLAAGEASMTRELTQLVAYLPRFDAALVQLGPAAVSLEHVLSRRATGASAVAAVYAAKAYALRNFRAAVLAVAARLHELRPPAVSKPSYRAQVSSLKGMAASAGRLADALSTGSLGGVPQLLASFDNAATQSHSRAVQRAQIAAVRAYDARRAQLTKLAQDVSLERLRLADTLR